MSGISSGPLVDQDDGGGGELERALDHLARIDWRVVELRRLRQPVGQPTDGAGRFIPGECIRFARDARQRLGVGRGLQAQELQRSADGRSAWTAGGDCSRRAAAAVPGTTNGGPSARPTATGTPATAGTTYRLPGREDADPSNL